MFVFLKEKYDQVHFGCKLGPVLSKFPGSFKSHKFKKKRLNQEEEDKKPKKT